MTGPVDGHNQTCPPAPPAVEPASDDATWEAKVAVALERVAAQEALEALGAVGNGLPVAGDQLHGLGPGDISAQLSENAARAVTSGRGVAVADGAYSRYLVIRTRHWLSLLTEWLHSPEGQAAVREAQVSVATALLVAADDADHADYGTGRELRTSHQSVAGRITSKVARGITGTGVRRYRWFFRKYGWQVEIARGRYLRGSERAAARARHGHGQLLGASVRALTTPTHIATQQARAQAAAGRQRARYERLKRALGHSICRVSSHQPRSGTESRSLQRSTAVQARKRARTNGSSRDESTSRQHSIAAHRLAAGLLADMPTGTVRRDARHRGHLVAAVAPLADAGWTVHEVKTVIDSYDQEHGWAPTPAQHQRRAIGLLITRIQRACQPAGRPMGGGRRGLLPTVPQPEERSTTETTSAAYRAHRQTTPRSTKQGLSRHQRLLQRQLSPRAQAFATATLGDFWRTAISTSKPTVQSTRSGG